MSSEPLTPLVIIESPYAGEIEKNVVYARAAAHDCALRGEASQASHLYYTQFLDDTKPDERALGIRLGLAWRRVVDYSVFYTDLGWSRGMLSALHDFNLRENRPFRIRSLYGEAKLPTALHEEVEQLLKSRIEPRR